MTMDDSSTNELILRAQSGAPGALDRLLAECSPGLHRYLERQVGGRLLLDQGNFHRSLER